MGETWFPPRFPHAEAERAGFEPATHLSARTRFPVALLRPLGHLSVLRSGEGGIRTLDGGIHPHNALAGRRLQPLGHFSAGPRRIAEASSEDGCTGKARASSRKRRRRVGASEGAAFSHSATSPRVGRRIAEASSGIPLPGEESCHPSTKMSVPAPPSYPGNLKPVCGYPRRVSPFKEPQIRPIKVVSRRSRESPRARP